MSDPSPWTPPSNVGADGVDDLVRRRQRGRAIVMAVLLGLLVALIFFVSIAKISAGHK